MIANQKLDFWIKNQYNVLFIGKHGVGKTSMIVEAFNRNKLKWAYFSAATMDPWVDFIGVPKEKKDGGKLYLELVRPQQFQDDEIQAIFFDEFNRAPKKVRNAVMELIQFKSINGKKFNNLKVIWAAINPEDSVSENDDNFRYDIEKLDPAQKDRFHVHIEIPYQCYATYFKNKYGDKAIAAIDWWNALSDEIKESISPRRLDYALDVHSHGGDLRDVLPYQSNINKLLTELESGSIKRILDNILQNKDADKARELMNDVNIWSYAQSIVLQKENAMEFFLPLIDNEKISKLIISNEKVLKHCANQSNFSQYEKVLREIVVSNINKKVAGKIKRICPSLKNMNIPKNKTPFSKTKCANAFDAELNAWEQNIKQSVFAKSSTLNRAYAFENIVYLVPKNITADTSLNLLALLDRYIIMPTQKRSLMAGIKIPNSFGHTIHVYKKLEPLIGHCLECCHQFGYKYSYVVSKLNPSSKMLYYMVKFQW